MTRGGIIPPPVSKGQASQTGGGIIAAGWGERLGKKQPKALIRVGEKALIEYALDGLETAGINQVTCIVNEAAREVPQYVGPSHRGITMDWIVQTTPSSMHSFLIVLERLAEQATGPFFISTVDSICSPLAYAQFVRDAHYFPEADVVLGLTRLVEDEKPLRVAMAGNENTGIMPGRVQDNPGAFEIIAMTNTGFDSEYVTAGFYYVRPTILKEKAAAFEQNFTALRQFLGHLLKYGYRTYGVPLPPVVDVDRPQDIQIAEQMICR